MPNHYRNTVDLNINGSYVDAGSLWLLADGMLILVDDDNFVETEFDLNLFEKVE